MSWCKVKVEYPLKQGLKHHILYLDKRIVFLVKVEYPLKQGLKLPVFLGCKSSLFTS